MGVRMVDVGGYSLAVEDEGNGSPPIVFVAAMGTARSTWRRVVSDLAGIRTIVYDRAGIGDSDPRPERRHAQDLVITHRDSSTTTRRTIRVHRTDELHHAQDVHNAPGGRRANCPTLRDTHRGREIVTWMRHRRPGSSNASC